MPLAVNVFRPRLYERPNRRRWQPTRAPLSFSVTGDVTVVLSINGVAATSVSGASTGGVYVRPAPRSFAKVGVG